MFCNGPDTEVSEKLREGGGQVVGVEATGVWKNPSVAAAEKGFLQADAGVFNARDDTVGVNANKGDDRWAPAFHLGLEAPAASAKFVIREFIRAGGGALDDVGDAEVEVKKTGRFKRGKESRGESAAVQGWPEPIARPAEMVADGRGVEAGIDAREENDEVFGGNIWNDLIAGRENLSLAGFPGNGQFSIHGAASSNGILGESEDCAEENFLGENFIDLVWRKLRLGHQESGRTGNRDGPKRS